MRISDWMSDVCSSDLTLSGAGLSIVEQNFDFDLLTPDKLMDKAVGQTITLVRTNPATGAEKIERAKVLAANGGIVLQIGDRIEVLRDRSEEHTSELQSLMRISYAVFCLKKKKTHKN